MDLDESLEDMVAKDAQLQYILSPQAEEQVRPVSPAHAICCLQGIRQASSPRLGQISSPNAFKHGL